MKNYNKLNLSNRMSCLTKSVKIYVPSTLHDKKTNNTEQVNETIEVLSELFGGCTTTENIGSYYSQELKKLILENITICNSFTTSEIFENNIDKVLVYVKKLQNELEQESIALQIDDKFLQTS